MKSFLLVLMALGAMAAVAQAQEEPCDPATSGAALIDLAEPIGKLACRVPSGVNLTDVMSKLTGTLNGVTAEQLQQLPGLIDLLSGIEPSALTPFLALSAAELERLVPLMTEVPVATLKTVLPLLAGQDVAVLKRMLAFLSKVSQARLQQLAPLFGRLTRGQANVMVHALNVLPEHAWDLLIAMMQALGPVTDATVAVKQHLGLMGGSSSASASASKSVSLHSLLLPSISVGPTVPAATTSSSKSAGKSFSISAAGIKHHAGRRLLQQGAEGGCDASAKGLELGVNLLGPFGAVVCKYGPDTLKPVLLKTIAALTAQSPEALARLPALTDMLGSVDPAVIGVFFKIPQATLKELVPLFGTIDASRLSTQLKLLSSLKSDDVSKMIVFLKATPASSLKMLVGIFAKLTDSQVDIMARLMNALSPGQITLSLKLLEKFGFAVDAIGQHIPESTARKGSGFSIGPVQVVYTNKA